MITSILSTHLGSYLPSARAINAPLPKVMKVALLCFGSLALTLAYLFNSYKLYTLAFVTIVAINKDPIMNAYKKYSLHRDIEERGGDYEYINQRWIDACYQSDLSILDELDKAYYVNPNLVDNSNKTAIMIAVESNGVHLVRFLRTLPNIILNDKDNDGNIPFANAAKLGFVEIVKELINDDVLTSRNYQEKTAEMLAQENRLSSVLSVISRYKDAQARSGQSA